MGLGKKLRKLRKSASNALASVGLNGGGGLGAVAGSTLGSLVMGPLGQAAGAAVGATAPDPIEMEAAPEMPTAASAEVEAEARKQRKKYGRAATLLTGGQGLTGFAPTAKRTLLGA